MPSQVITSVENNFTKGLVTEFTGLNFPENAATDTSNCIYTIVGDVVRRYGMNGEVNGIGITADISNKAISSYVWNNAGGDGNTVIEVLQIGGTLAFFRVNTATTTLPLSNQQLGTLDITQYVVNGIAFDATLETTYADGNGYLFVFHPNCDPIGVTYSSGICTGSRINIEIRDFIGVNDQLNVNTRPTNLGVEHSYNLQNQGWVTGNAWYATSNTIVPTGTGSRTWFIGTGYTITNGTVVQIKGNSPGSPFQVNMNGTVTNYSSGNLTVNVTSENGNFRPGWTFNVWSFTPISIGYVNTWATAEGNYPSNADVWWYFKNSSGAFDPANTVNNVSLATGNAPQGHFILNAFNMDRSTLSGLANITAVSTTSRPTNGAWYAGRIWYTGVTASQPASGNTNFYTWSENIYFSQVVETPSDFGLCYQTNDPTSEQLNGELPTDGGVIVVQGSGTVYKLFPIQNGMLVFAANGVWFITGSQGIGFAANDYTITKISDVRSISSTSYVNVLGLPYFWNEEGIYHVVPTQTGALTVEPLTIGTILSFYNKIPLSSKKYVKGAYDPINYILQWTYRSTQETSISNRYQFDTILNYNTYNKAFYPFTIATSTNGNYIHGINYISYPFVNSGTPLPGFKYPCTFGNPTLFTFADIHDTSYVDWGNVNYDSYFITGYKVHGKGLMKFNIPYVVMYSRNVGNYTTGYTSYAIQGVWDYANTGNTGRWSTLQFVEHNDAKHDVLPKRIRIRGRGYTLQIKVTSVQGKPFDIIGWAVYENLNQGV